jgi:hypothetical protein
MSNCILLRVTISLSKGTLPIFLRSTFRGIPPPPITTGEVNLVKYSHADYSLLRYDATYSEAEEHVRFIRRGRSQQTEIRNVV